MDKPWLSGVSMTCICFGGVVSEFYHSKAILKRVNDFFNKKEADI